MRSTVNEEAARGLVGNVGDVKVLQVNGSLCTRFPAFFVYSSVVSEASKNHSVILLILVISLWVMKFSGERLPFKKDP